MGKRYHCDYCDKTMVAAPSVIRTHNNGVSHQKLFNQHYQQFKDPETILAEEANKKPCNWFFNNGCQFGSLCRFSHYSREEIESLRQSVASKKQKNLIGPTLSFFDLYMNLQNEKTKNVPEDNTTTLYDNNGVTHVLPWSYNNVLDSYGDNLPPSLKRIKLEDFRNANFSEWG